MKELTVDTTMLSDLQALKLYVKQRVQVPRIPMELEHKLTILGR